jgi:hypothetical protein
LLVSRCSWLVNGGLGGTGVWLAGARCAAGRLFDGSEAVGEEGGQRAHMGLHQA